MNDEGLGSWPARRARKTPDRVAVVHHGQERTYRDLADRVQRLAAALRGLGLRRGDRVAYLGANHPAFLETLFAAGTLGAIFVPLNTRLAEEELAFVLEDSGSTVLVHSGDHADFAEKSDGLAHRVAPARYETLLAEPPEGTAGETVGLDDPCMLMYTSGTTGRPKGAVLTHGNIIWNALNVIVDIDLAGDEVTLVAAPLFHTAGLNMTCLPTLLKGGRVVLLDRFDPGAVLEVIESLGVTYMFGVPTMFDAMAAHPRWAGTDLTSLRQLACGGAPVPETTIRAYLDRGLGFSQGYGMTECSPGVLFLDREHARSKAGTAGVPEFFTDVRLARPDGADAGVGETGEVLVRGPNVTTGYWGLPEASAAAFQDGWFRSGDLAKPDADGFVSIVDRIKDVIISGGENVYPAEVESSLLNHPAVADAAVIGVPDERWGEVGRAVVVPRSPGAPTERELLGFLDGKLAKYKIPKSVVFAPELPRNGTGKLLKAVLRAEYGDPEPGR
jgi:acyl-CoA synthetase (AMP-forming)/AMP-acid ligase II